MSMILSATSIHNTENATDEFEEENKLLDNVNQKIKFRDYQAIKLKSKMDKDIRSIKEKAKVNLIAKTLNNDDILSDIINVNNFQTIDLKKPSKRFTTIESQRASKQKKKNEQMPDLRFNTINNDYYTNVKFKFKNIKDHCSHSVFQNNKRRIRSNVKVNDLDAHSGVLPAVTRFIPTSDSKSQIIVTDNRNYERKSHFKIDNPMIFINCGDPSIYLKPERLRFWTMLFKSEENSLRVKQYLEEKFSLDKLKISPWNNRSSLPLNNKSRLNKFSNLNRLP